MTTRKPRYTEYLFGEEAERLEHEVEVLGKHVRDKEEGFIHGDVINFGDDRCAQAYIACDLKFISPKLRQKHKVSRDQEGVLLLANQGDYLYVPECITVNAGCDDVCTLFSDIVPHCSSIYFYVDHNDAIIRKRFGDEIPHLPGCLYCFELLDGENSEGISVCKLKNEADRDDFAMESSAKYEFFTVEDNDTAESLEARINVKQAEFVVRISLDNDNKSKWYRLNAGEHEPTSSEGRKFAERASPALPAGWKIRWSDVNKGKHCWEFCWTFTGPTKSLEEMKSSANSFLEPYEEVTFV